MPKSPEIPSCEVMPLGFPTRLCTWYLDRLPVGASCADDDTGTLNRRECLSIVRIRWKTSLAAFLISAACAIGFFLPAYMGLYPSCSIEISGKAFLVEWAFWGAMVPWLLIEITLMVILNLTSVHSLAVATGFLTPQNKARVEPQVVRIALAAPARELARLGLDPYQDANPVGLFVFNFLQMTKGLLAHQAIKLLLIGIGGRAALRAVLDFSGLPIYAAINALAANRIIDEAKIIVMGKKAIEQLGSSLPNMACSASFQDSVYDALQFIAMSKRDFHPNHVALADAVLDRYEIPLRDSHKFTEDSVARFRSLPPDQRKIVSLVVVSGLVLDGRLSARERKRLALLNGDELLGVSERQMRRWAEEFRSGEGISGLLQDNGLFGCGNVIGGP